MKTQIRSKDTTLDVRDNSLLGAAGELRVASELLKRGIRCYHPYADQGIDIITAGGIKIQVKTARTGETLSYYKDGKPRFRYLSFAFNLKKTTNLDFCIVWLLEPDIFFIIPFSVLKNRGEKQTHRIYIEGKKDTLFTPYHNAWDLITG